MELINQKEWCKLYELGVIDCEEYKLDSRFRCNAILNRVITEDKFLERLLFDEIVFPLHILPFKEHGHKKSLRELEFSKIPYMYLDHYQIIQFNQNWSNIEGIDCFKGIFNFPYNYDINSILKEENEIELGEMWETYIINPRFLQYNSSCIGIYLMPKIVHIEDLVSDLNGYFIKLTGYPLLFKPTLEDIEPIEQITLKLNRENFIKPFMKKNPPKEDIMFYKLLEFWAENECVTVNEFKSSFSHYNDNISHSLWIGFNLKTIKSDIPFEFVQIHTGDKLGPFTHFEYDPAFDCYYDGSMTSKPIDEKIKFDFNNGNYDIRLVKDSK